MIQNREHTGINVLQGQRVLVTRARAQAGKLSRLLCERGAVPVELATIEIIPNPYPEQTRQTIARLGEYDWLIFTSVNAVETFFDATGGTLRDRTDASVAAVGRATGRALRANGIEPDLMPARFQGDALLEELVARGVRGKRMLLPRAEVARESLPEGLKRAGAHIDVLPVYRTVPAHPAPEMLQQLRDGEIDIVTLTSSSAVTNLIAALNGNTGILAAIRLACIGPITAQTVREAGLEPWVVAEEHTVPGLIDAISTALEGKS